MGQLFKHLQILAKQTSQFDSFTGDGSTLTFTLGVAASAADQIIVFISNIYQQPSTYSITGGGNDITLTEAPLLNEAINVIQGIGSTP